MGLYDQHIHSRHSFDSRSDPGEIVLRALDIGLAGVTFTEHYDTHPEDWRTCRYDDEAYSADIAALRDEFGRKIVIGKGIEVCYQPDRMEDILEFLTAHEFDAVLLSVHWAGAWPIYRREHWEGRTAEDVSREYLTAVRNATAMCVRLNRQGESPFNILGHLDLVRRYRKRFLQTDEPLGHGDLVDEILRNCLAADLVPEINTSSLRQGLSEPMPEATVIQRYADLGGTVIVLGSDAHTVEDIGAGLDHAASMARRCGIDRLAVFTHGHMEEMAMAGD